MRDTPVIVIGAARSGTNLLRDIICAFDGHSTWPCDEINYIWRHGNRDALTDELTADDARPEVVRFIRRAFDRQRSRQGGGVVVEKTCANSLRVEFVDRILPDARYVYIERGGRDVVASAIQRWRAKLDIPYVARKARFVPVRDLPYYATRYIRARAYRLRSTERRLASWGPRFEGIDELLSTATLAEVCAHQWRRSVDLAQEQLSQMPPERVLRVKFEDLVASPAEHLCRLGDFLATPVPSMADIPVIKTQSVGRWEAGLDPEVERRVRDIIRSAPVE